MSRHLIDDDPLAMIEARPYCRKHAGNVIVDGEVRRYWDDCDCQAVQVSSKTTDQANTEVNPKASSERAGL